MGEDDRLTPLDISNLWEQDAGIENNRTAGRYQFKIRKESVDQEWTVKWIQQDILFSETERPTVSVLGQLKATNKYKITLN